MAIRGILFTVSALLICVLAIGVLMAQEEPDPVEPEVPTLELNNANTGNVPYFFIEPQQVNSTSGQPTDIYTSYDSEANQILEPQIISDIADRPAPFLYWPLADNERNWTYFPCSTWSKSNGKLHYCIGDHPDGAVNAATVDHGGTDVRVPEGTLVYPSSPGVVVAKCPDPNYPDLLCNDNFGRYIKIRHEWDENGQHYVWHTVYGHLSQVLFDGFPTITNIGDPIGLSGNTGASTGAHLHFQVNYGEGELPTDPFDTNLGSLWIGSNDRPTSAVNGGSTTASTQFDFASSNQGWTIERDLTFLENNDGGMIYLVTGGDPGIKSPTFEGVYAEDFSHIVLFMGTQVDDCGEIYFRTAGQTNFSAENYVSFDLTVGGEGLVKVRMADNPNWKGQIVQLRLDPACEFVSDSDNGVRIDTLAFATESTYFNFNSARLGWTSGDDVNFSGHVDGGMHYYTTGTDPGILSPILVNINAADFPYVVLWEGTEADDCGQIYFRKEGEANFTDLNFESFNPAPGEEKLIKVRMADDPNWNGNIAQIRLDPACATGAVRINFFGFGVEDKTSFDFASSRHGFTSVNDLFFNNFIDGGMHYLLMEDNRRDSPSPAWDPWIYSPFLIGISAEDFTHIDMLIGTQADSCGQIYFRREQDISFDETRVVHISPVADSVTDMHIDMASDDEWTGNIVQLRIDPACGPNGEPDALRINTLTFTNPPTPPVVTNPGNQISMEGAAVSLQIAATDADGNTLTYTANNLPSGLTINASTGLISGTVAAGTSANSPYNITVSVSNGAVTTPVSFTWIITEITQAGMTRLNPANEQVVGGISQYTSRFQWVSQDGAEWYHVYVSTPDLSVIFQNTWYKASDVCQGTVCTVTHDIWLTGNGSYAWWMTYWNPAVNDTYMTLYNSSTFTLNMAQPGSVTGGLPSGQINSGNVTLQWNAEPNTLWYQVWTGPEDYSQATFFQWVNGADVCTNTICSIQVPKTLAQGKYEFWIQGWNPAGTTEWRLLTKYTIGQ